MLWVFFNLGKPLSAAGKARPHRDSGPGGQHLPGPKWSWRLWNQRSTRRPGPFPRGPGCTRWSASHPSVPYLRPSTTPQACPLAVWSQPEPQVLLGTKCPTTPRIQPNFLPPVRSPPHEGLASLISHLLPDVGCAPAGPRGQSCAAGIQADEEPRPLGSWCKAGSHGTEKRSATPHVGVGAGCNFTRLSSLCSTDGHPGRPGALVSVPHETGPHMSLF